VRAAPRLKHGGAHLQPIRLRSGLATWHRVRPRAGLARSVGPVALACGAAAAQARAAGQPPALRDIAPIARLCRRVAVADIAGVSCLLAGPMWPH
jgi:hypothetical protein